MIEFAYAADAVTEPGGALLRYAPLVFILLAFYFLIMRPQQKKLKAHQAMLASLKKGDVVLTGAGIKGRVQQIGERFITLEVANNVCIEIDRNGISSRLESNEA